MTKNRQNQKGVVDLAIIFIILAAIGITVYLAVQSQVIRLPGASRRSPEAPDFPAKEITTQVPAINNQADLENILDELENTNTDAVNEMLFQNDSDGSSF